MIGATDLKSRLYHISPPSMLFAQPYSINIVTKFDCDLVIRTPYAMKRTFPFVCNNANDLCEVCHMTK